MTFVSLLIVDEEGEEGGEEAEGEEEEGSEAVDTEGEEKEGEEGNTCNIRDVPFEKFAIPSFWGCEKLMFFGGITR